MPEESASTDPVDAARFASVVRSWDESPQNAFSVSLAGHPMLYGVWALKWARNGNDFDIEVQGFGWVSQHNIGNPNPKTRRTFPPVQADYIKTLVTSLFTNVEARNQTSPFSNKIARFMGGIEFQKDWISVAE